MSKKTISTCEELDAYLRSVVSEKRYRHSVGVAETVKRLIEHYGIIGFTEEWNGFDAGTFCGLSHDLARELEPEDLISGCQKAGIKLEDYELDFPVLTHSYVSVEIAKDLCGDFPEDWKKAIEHHTTGKKGMNGLELAVFVADFIEPTRAFLTETDRKKYMSEPSIEACAYSVLCDMIDHWNAKGGHINPKCSLEMKADLEKRISGDEK